MRYRVRHITQYTYEKPVSLGYNRAHLLPRDTARQRCISTEVRIKPLPTTASQRADYFGNNCYHFSLEDSHRSLSIDVVSEIEVEDTPQLNDFDLDLGVTCADALTALSAGQSPEVLEAREFLLASPMIQPMDALAEFARPLFQPERPLLSATRALTEKIFTEFTYDPASTTVATPLSDVLAQKRGVCQDFAHLAIGCLRSLGFPARYISGYLETLPPPGQEKLIGADASHAWFAVFSPGEGWFAFDPTNNNMPSGQHIVTAEGRDYSDVTPLRGVIFDGGSWQKLKVSVDVSRLDDSR